MEAVRRLRITVAAYVAALVILIIPVMFTRMMDYLRRHGRDYSTSEDLGMSLGDFECMSNDDLSDYILGLATSCPIDLPKYCCPIVEFRRLDSADINYWVDGLNRRDKLNLVSVHYGCAKWNQRY